MRMKDALASTDVNIRSFEEPQSNFKREEYEKAVERCKEYIKAGDIFQVVLSQRFSINVDADPFDLYRVLRVVNP
jgi:anthranilate synthase component 1